MVIIRVGKIPCQCQLYEQAISAVSPCANGTYCHLRYRIVKYFTGKFGKEVRCKKRRLTYEHINQASVCHKLTKNAVYSMLHSTSNAKIFQTIVLK
jgi:hypothetical protein